MDRYFNSELLLDLMDSEAEVSGTGTIQKIRVPKNSKLRDDNQLQREGRGSVDQSVRSDGQVTLVK